MDLQLKGHTTLITGAGNGIGLAAARAFAEEGSSLILWDLDASVQMVAQEIADQTSVAVTANVVDVAAWEQVEEGFAKITRDIPSLHHVVHCAAIGSGKFGFPFTNLQPTDWRRTLEVNVLGMVNVAHATAPYFLQRRSGSYVFLASVAGQIGSPTDPPYSASKAANINFAQVMAKDLAPHGIRVNTVCPGMVQTKLNRSVWQAWFDQQEATKRMSYEAWAEQKIRAIVPLGQWQTPADLAAMIVFLSSPRAQQITGQTINVDGGFVMHW